MPEAITPAFHRLCWIAQTLRHRNTQCRNGKRYCSSFTVSYARPDLPTLPTYAYMYRYANQAQASPNMSTHSHGAIPSGPSSARSSGSYMSSHSEGRNVPPNGRRVRTVRHPQQHQQQQHLPHLKNLPSGVNSDGGRVSPILSVVTDVDAIMRSEAVPTGFQVDVYTHHRPQPRHRGKANMSNATRS